jgi:bis(5'-nucleosyl)-tetraphosphatase (symmetrical)
MATYCIGDIQGCFDELQRLLKVIKFDAKKDQLWFVGDLVNRGAKSLEVLRFVKNLPNSITVLGNHDFHLLAVYHKLTTPRNHNFHDILEAEDSKELIEWLRLRPLLYHDQKFNCVLTHAGILPAWDLILAKNCAKEVEEILHAKNYMELLKYIYGNKPDKWSYRLRGWSRLRFIINSFTRMRFCDIEGRLDLSTKGDIGSEPKGYMPWFKVPWRKNKNVEIVFGHWAALNGKTGNPKLHALDTGCVWGGALTAMRLEDKKLFQVRC